MSQIIPQTFEQRVTYVCGKCGKELRLRANDHVKCTNCGYRILYKKRIIDNKQPIQYEAI